MGFHPALSYLPNGIIWIFECFWATSRSQACASKDKIHMVAAEGQLMAKGRKQLRQGFALVKTSWFSCGFPFTAPFS